MEQNPNLELGACHGDAPRLIEMSWKQWRLSARREVANAHGRAYSS